MNEDKLTPADQQRKQELGDAYLSGLKNGLRLAGGENNHMWSKVYEEDFFGRTATELAIQAGINSPETLQLIYLQSKGLT